MTRTLRVTNSVFTLIISSSPNSSGGVGVGFGLSTGGGGGSPRLGAIRSIGVGFWLGGGVGLWVAVDVAGRCEAGALVERLTGVGVGVGVDFAG